MRCERFLNDGFDNYLTKPIVFDKFKTLLRVYLEHAVSLDVHEKIEGTSKKNDRIVEVDRIHRELNFAEKLIHRLLKSYLDFCDPSMDKLQEAVEQGDMKQIEMNAHAIKGAASNLSLHPVVKLAQIMEENSRMEQSIDYHALVIQLIALNEQVKTEIREILE